MRNLINIIKFITRHPFNEGKKLSAVSRFLKYQVAIRLIKSKFLIDWVDDSKILVSAGETGLTGNMYCGLMEYRDMCFLLHFTNQTDTFYDIGANVGAYTILASGVNKMKSICFEPLPSTYDRLLDQIKVNRIDNLVEARNNGVGKNNEVLEFTNNLNCTNRVNTDPSNTDVTKVDVITLDDCYEPNTPSIVKIDIEGYEKFVFEGGMKFFDNPNVVALIVELNGSGDTFGIDDSEVHKMITSFGFRPVAYDPFNRKISPLDSFMGKENTIYVKDLDHAQNRVSDSPSICIHTANKLTI
jgi:FkbM family methyltransferase